MPYTTQEYRRRKNLKIKKSKKIFIQEKNISSKKENGMKYLEISTKSEEKDLLEREFFDFEIFFSSLKNDLDFILGLLNNSSIFSQSMGPFFDHIKNEYKIKE
ncbi:hypothetical protein BpHYR1_053558 [Brachionus plicatilis]|uniref:Uncharacterized protein n=1 Tax=Brachionus plicatilis TaxID=10195 RepID=A0A3M7RRP5_BRAPC|nr:hypothetical protein BpHYR1_053558 [Brachionus plicatilis]